MDGTLFVARAQEQFSAGYAIYFWVRDAPIVAPKSHLWRIHLPSIRHAHLHQRYAFSAAHVRYRKDKGFMGGTLFVAVRYSCSSRTLIVRSAYHNSCASVHQSTFCMGQYNRKPL